MKKDKAGAILLFVYGVINYTIFALDTEYDRDFWTWMWLLSSILWFFGSLNYWIKYKSFKNREADL